MKLGLVGFPASGKTTVFNAVTGSERPVGTYSSIPDIHLGTVEVADERLRKLHSKFPRAKYVPARFDCLDITGLVTGSGRRHEFDPKTLNDVRQCDALGFILRVFDDDTVPHPKGEVDPDRDFADAALEMLFADLLSAENRVERLEKQIHRFNRSEDKAEMELMKRIRDHLETEKPMRELELSIEERKRIKGFQFLTLKPWLKVYNIGENEFLAGDYPETWNSPDKGSLAMCGRIEMEISQLEASERGEFFSEMGIEEPVAGRLARLAYRMLGLLSFFTIGDDEVRAWTITSGTPAVEAAGVIHSDLARGFIRAETVAYDDYERLGDMKSARSAGKLRLEGKEYIVRDGDIINIRFNV